MPKEDSKMQQHIWKRHSGNGNGSNQRAQTQKCGGAGGDVLDCALQAKVVVPGLSSVQSNFFRPKLIPKKWVMEFGRRCGYVSRSCLGHERRK